MRTDRLLPRAARALFLAAGLALAVAAPAQAPPAGPADPYAEAPPPDEPRRAPRVRSEIRPYLEVDQVVSARLNGDSDVLTYTAVAAGVDGRIVTRRVTAQMSYRYERRIEWNGDLPDADVHSGVAAVHAEVIPGTLALDAGALATRTGGDGRALGLTDRDPSVEVYSAYAGPTLSARAGPVAINGSYRVGYVAVDDDTAPAAVPREELDEAVAHSATASVGMAPGQLPFGWTVGAGYAREESGDLDHEFEGVYVRGDVVVPVTSTLALTAGVGYEKMEASQDDILVDANGDPVVGPDGRLVADPSRPRLLALDIDGLIYDAGIIWRPTARTELQARAGHRYGGTTIVASFEHRFRKGWGISAQVYDGIETFGRLLINDLSGLPGEFQTTTEPLAGDLGLGGCVFGADPGSGVCLDRALQSIAGASFRHRGASVLLSGGRGPWDFGLGAGYARRRYFQPEGSLLAALEPRVDESVSVYGTVGRELGRDASVTFHAFASWFDSDRPAFDERFSTGFTASYSRTFLVRRLQLLAAFGIYHNEADLADATFVTALLGLRYTF